MVVVITGASGGVGRATAPEFAKRGDAVALLARNEDALEGAAREVRDAGGRALAIPTDVADPEQVEAAAERVTQELGDIDVWVNDAMATILAPFWEITADEFRRTTEVTYLGQVYGTMAALKRMRPRDGGTIVQVGSALAYRGIPLQAAYCGAKHAIRGFRLAAHRADAREERRAGHHRPPAGAQHDAVRTRPHAHAAQAAAGRARLPARGRRARDRVGERAPLAPRALGRRVHRDDDPRHAPRARGHRRPLPREDRLRRPADRRAGRRAPPRDRLPLLAGPGRPRPSGPVRRRVEGPQRPGLARRAPLRDRRDDRRRSARSCDGRALPPLTDGPLRATAGRSVRSRSGPRRSRRRAGGRPRSPGRRAPGARRSPAARRTPSSPRRTRRSAGAARAIGTPPPGPRRRCRTGRRRGRPTRRRTRASPRSGRRRRTRSARGGRAGGQGGGGARGPGWGGARGTDSGTRNRTRTWGRRRRPRKGSARG